MYDKIVNPKTGIKINVRSKLGKAVIKKYIDQLGGGLSKEDTTKFKKLLTETYPIQLANEVGGLIAGQDVKSIDEAMEKWSENLHNMGIDIEEPTKGKTYASSFMQNGIDDDTETKELQTLIPPTDITSESVQTSAGPIASCDPENGCVGLDACDYKDVYHLINNYGLDNSELVKHKWLTHCGMKREDIEKPAPEDICIVDYLDAHRLFFRHYLKLLPNLSNGNVYLSNKVLYLLSRLSPDMSDEIRLTLTWELMEQDTCIYKNGVGTGCVNPLNINEVLGWTNIENKYRNKTTTYINFIEKNNEKIKKLVKDYEGQVPKYKPDFGNEFQDLYNDENDIHRILFLESIKYEKEFYTIDAILFLVKFAINIYVMEGASADDKDCIRNFIDKCHLKKNIQNFFLTKEQILTECMAGIGEKIKNKNKMFSKFLEHPLNPMPKSIVVYNDIIKDQQDETDEIKNIVDSFFSNCLFKSDMNGLYILLPMIYRNVEKILVSDMEEKEKEMKSKGSFVPLGAPGMWPEDVLIFTGAILGIL